jgi:hypothetical protein
MKLEEVNQKTKEAVDFLVAALESGHSEVLTRAPRNPEPAFRRSSVHS